MISKTERLDINGIPSKLWGLPSDRVYIYVHGKMGSKEDAAAFAVLAEEQGLQTLSFDLPQHGERARQPARCDVWNGVHDLEVIARYVARRWQEVSLFGCSLGAYFSLQAYAGQRFRRCLFQSPVVDMEYLVRQMMLWFDVTEERLEREREIDTPIDPLRWDYWQYIITHPVQSWNTPTAILYGGEDNLQSRQGMDEFARRFDCRLTVAEGSGHAFDAQGDGAIIDEWLRENICF